MKRCRLMRRILLLSLALTGAFAVQALAEDAANGPNEARRAKVFAKVGPRTITVGELEDLVNSKPPYTVNRFSDPELLREFAYEQVQNELFYQGAEKLGYANDPGVESFLTQTLVQLFVRKDFEEAVTPDDVPAEDVVKYYAENSEEFRRPEMRRARHILLGSKKEAEQVRVRVQTDGTTTFRALAKRRSLDTETNIRGGDLLYFDANGLLVGTKEEERIDPSLAKAAFSLEKAGDLSEPIDLGDGKWSVLELTGIRPVRVQTLEQAEGLIRRKLWRVEREAALDSLMTQLREELKPEVYPERMDAIVLPTPKEPIEHPDQ